MPKYCILTLGAKAPGVSDLGHTSLESSFDAIHMKRYEA